MSRVLPPPIDFPPFRLDRRAEQLTRDGTPIPLRPKTYAVLRYLAERPGALVTKRELLDAVWGGAVVTEDVVRLSAGEVRAALGDDRAVPRFIETVPRRGYRFIAKMSTTARMPTPSATRQASAAPADGCIVGRERERAEIGAWLEAARIGTRRIGFIVGEAGIVGSSRDPRGHGPSARSGCCRRYLGLSNCGSMTPNAPP